MCVCVGGGGGCILNCFMLLSSSLFTYFEKKVPVYVGGLYNEPIYAIIPTLFTNFLAILFLSLYLVMFLLPIIMQSVQLPVKVEHSGAAMDNASNLLTVVMELENALMAVMRLDVVSNHSGLAFIITAIAYRVEVNFKVFSLISQL